MPFDGSGFSRRGNQPRRETGDDNLVSALLIVIALVLLLTPISLGALVDIVRAVR